MKNGVVGDLGVAFEHFKSLPKLDPDCIGVVGFCMGGPYGLQLPRTGHGMNVDLVCYGINPWPLSAIANGCSVVETSPASDRTPIPGRMLMRVLEKRNFPQDMKTYPNSALSFCNGELHGFGADAWQRKLASSGEHINSGQAR